MTNPSDDASSAETTPTVGPGPFDPRTAWSKEAELYGDLLRESMCGKVRVIVELGVHWGYSLFTLARDFPEATVYGVDNLSYEDSGPARAHLERHAGAFPNITFLEGDSAAIGRSWVDPSMFRPVDILHIDADHGYASVAADFAAWEPHVRPGGAVMFHDVVAFADSVGRFFDELEGGKKVQQENIGIWFKDPVLREQPVAPRTLYLELLKRSLLDSIRGGDARDALSSFEGRTIPTRPHTMIGRVRLDDLQYCLERVLSDEIEGDFIETGVWRGGAVILMRAVLKAWGHTDRRVWVADSFEGVPPPRPELYPQDRGLVLHEVELLSVSLDQVQARFRDYGLLDEQVVFLPGWFRNTLPSAPIERLAVLRLDGDLYESTMDALTYLYPKLAVGGYVIVDDYGAIRACRRPVDDYRAAHGITEEIVRIDWAGVRWRRESIPSR